MRPKETIINSLFEIAKELDTKALGVRTRMVAAVLNKGKVVAVGHNSKKTHPLQGKFSKNEHAIYLHAEVDAIKNAIRKVGVDALEGMDVIVVRAKKVRGQGWVFGDSKPCPGCERCIAHFNFKNTYYYRDGTLESFED